MRKSSLLIAILFLSLTILNFVKPLPTKALPLNERSVRIGSSIPSAVTTNRFSFTLGSVSNLGSIEFEYCQNDPLVGQPCAPPLGFSASSVVLQSQTGETGFSISPLSTNNKIILTRTSVPSSAIPVTYTFRNITLQSP